MNNILLVECEMEASKTIRMYLEKEGYKVHYTTKGLKAIQILKRMDIKLIILDLSLHDIDGKTLCRMIRKISNVHIFALIDNDNLNDKVEVLKAGADQYLIKPVNAKELLARVNAVFRRLYHMNKVNNESDNLIFNSGRVIIDCNNRIVRVNGKRISLTPNEFNILYTLAINEGKVLSRHQIINKVFGIDFKGYDRTIDVHIKNIRKKIEKDRRKPKYIITVIKAGYKFCGDN